MTLLSNQLVLLGIFLLGKLCILNVTRGFPSLSNLNNCDHSMCNLNRSLSSIALRLDLNTPNCLLKPMYSASLMKGVRNFIVEHDEILQYAIDALKWRIRRDIVNNVGSNEDSDDIET